MRAFTTEPSARPKRPATAAWTSSLPIASRTSFKNSRWTKPKVKLRTSFAAWDTSSDGFSCTSRGLAERCRQRFGEMAAGSHQRLAGMAIRYGRCGGDRGGVACRLQVHVQPTRDQTG